MNLELQARSLSSELSKLPKEDLIKALNMLRAELSSVSPFRDNPIDCVQWVKTNEVGANDYNPNSVAPKEMDLLKTSILEDGYTQPVVTFAGDKGYLEIVDGFHRTRVAKELKEVKELLGGYLPVVKIRTSQSEKSNRMASTIRHNRARGTHSVDAMSEIVLELKSRNWKTARICRELGMEEDEVLRLCQISGLTHLFSDAEFSEAWESDSCTVDEDLDFSADEEATTQNTSDPNRIFHTFDKWEHAKAGFFLPGLPNRKKEDCEKEYAEFLSDAEAFDKAIEALFLEWPNACEHNLTNSSMNRIAWLGQAAACYAIGLPSTFRAGFSSLEKEKQESANGVAHKRLNLWLSSRGMEEISIEQATSSRNSDLF